MPAFELSSLESSRYAEDFGNSFGLWFESQQSHSSNTFAQILPV
jgi:hypothetical protein